MLLLWCILYPHFVLMHAVIQLNTTHMHTKFLEQYLYPFLDACIIYLYNYVYMSIYDLYNSYFMFVNNLGLPLCVFLVNRPWMLQKEFFLVIQFFCNILFEWKTCLFCDMTVHIIFIVLQNYTLYNRDINITYQGGLGVQTLPEKLKMSILY